MEVECKFLNLDESFGYLTKNDIKTLHDVIEEIEKLAAIKSLDINDVCLEISRRDGNSGEHIFVITQRTQTYFTAEYRGVQKF